MYYLRILLPTFYGVKIGDMVQAKEVSETNGFYISINYVLPKISGVV